MHIPPHSRVRTSITWYQASTCVRICAPLRQSGKVTADETEKGWYIQWIDRDPRLLAMQEAAARREKADLDDEEKQART